MAAFKGGEQQNCTESQESGAADGGLGQRRSKQYTRTLKPPKMVDGRFEEEKAQNGNRRGTPEDLRMPFMHQGSPRRDECIPHLEKATGGLASPAASPAVAVAPKPYECEECGDQFRLKGLLRIHQMVALRKLSLPCPACGICFRSCWHLWRHEGIHKRAHADSGGADCLDVCRGAAAEERSHLCADCGESFCGYLDFLQHQKSHEEVKVWPCAQCDAAFTYRSELAMHEESHFDEASRVPSPCGENCVCRFSFLLHLASQLEKSTEGNGMDAPEDEKPPWVGEIKRVKPYSCHQCGQEFRLEENLEVHYRYCHKERLQKYRYREKKPGHQKDDKKRVRNRSVPKAGRSCSSTPLQTSSARWACSHCGKTFTSRYGLFKHQQRHKEEARQSAAKLDKSVRHKEEEGQAATKLDESVRHKAEECRTATKLDGSVRHKVEECRTATKLNKNASSTNGLGGRAPISITKKLHKCQECGKKFVFKRQLVAHMKAHPEESSSQRTSHEDSYKDHIQISSGTRAPSRWRQGDFSAPSVAAEPRRQGEEELCPCAQCGKSFTKRYFADHQAWHAGVRFMCRLCGSLCNFKSGGYRHLQQHRKRGDFSTCPKCGVRGQSQNCFCLIERIHLGQNPLPLLYNQEGASRPTEG
ncbi:zinc finger protein 850-like [Heteronotia binoei]|uniref:zinc finger protein 850-like n=1 Tax=Heteronotia binoei TaxID=13085 RepID=UPI00292FC00F|nr:zinc finger protein 850-like [Heteronotia binoei]